VSGYAAFSWTPGHALAEARMALIRQPLLARSGWRVADSAPGLLIMIDPVRAMAVRRFGWRSGRVIGDLFERSSHKDAGPVLARPTWIGSGREALCEHLTSAYWGRYVVAAPHLAGEGGFVFRGPAGGPECMTWRRDGVCVATSGLADWLLVLLPPALSLSLPVITGFLLDPAKMSARLGLDGVRAALPGASLDMSFREPEVLVWRPADFARARSALAAPQALTRLAPTIDACLAALAQSMGPILAEVSGGLDSSIMASALEGCGADVRQWINFHASDSQADERAYARALAWRLEFSLTEVAKPEIELTREGLAGLPLCARPSLNGLDRHYDEAMAEHCLDLGAQAIFTGQGGDVLFQQAFTPLLAADLFRKGAGPGRAGRLIELARWSRGSIWALVATAAVARLGFGSASVRRAPAFVAREAAQAATGLGPHPWLGGLEGVTPAKQRQIHGLAHAQLAFGDCRRSRVADLVHPLISQPIVELCLAISAIDLTEARRDRAMIRRAFASRLPGMITQRRSKGDLTAYYARMLVRSLSVLRPFLLEGWLAQQGVLNRPVLEAMLCEESLITDGAYPDLMELIVVEAWARGWDSAICNQAYWSEPGELIWRGDQDPGAPITLSSQPKTAP
jgi:asparagine synthase (glutamine-hydrolysing)